MTSEQTETAFPVEQQLEAYNARDIDAFMAWWAEDCEYYEFPNRLLARGAGEIRERHAARFEEPNLHGRLLQRIVVANFVVDQETVTRTFPDGPGEVDVIAMYEVANGKIAKAWFRMGPRRLGTPVQFLLRRVLLRRADPEDAGAIRSLTREAYAKWVPIIGREPLPMTVDYREAVRKHRFDLLYVDGKLAALIETVPEDDHLLIENIAVLPEFQNKGLGHKLLTHAEKIAASLRYAETRLYTNKLFATNVELYKRVGYGIDREEDFKGGITVYMSKPVPDTERSGHSP